MPQQDLVIRIAGEAGEGIQSTGQLLTQAAARAGFRVLTDFVPPAEIKGGNSLYQVRLSPGELHHRGDAVDILMAFTPEAYEVNIGDLRPGGLLIYDSAEFTPPEADEHERVALPLTEIAKTRLRFERGKNVVSFGAAAALFGLPKEFLTKLVQDRFGKYVELLPKNLEAVEAGMRYVEENVPQREQYYLASPPPAEDILVVSGNQAISMGALVAGCRFFAGYPITPASDILEFLVSELPKVGGDSVQAEDEMAALGMVIGASYAGKKAMTSTAGPGFSLMQELLGLAVMAEIPCVVADIQRAGPSTGMPTRHEQGDLNIAALGGHGEVPRIVLAPTSVEDCFFQAINAFNLSEKYQTPVILLSDTVLAVRTQSIPKPDLSQVEIIDRLTVADTNGHNGSVPSAERKFERYALTETGVSPMGIPGQAGGEYVATGLEHNTEGRPRSDPKFHTAMTEKRFRKLEYAAKEAPPALRYGDPVAEVGIVTWGSTAGTVIEAIDRAAEQGLKAELLAPKMLRPLPDHQLADWLRSKRVVICPEVNYSGQLADFLMARYGVPLVKVNVYNGRPFTVERLVEAMSEVIEHVR
jgi:2-oxoglutarate ferredoxin oxidoreductase subunit alpha